MQNESIGNEVVRYDWSRKIRSPPLRNRFTVTLLKCDRDTPPRRIEQDVLVEGEIVCQVNKPFHEMPQSTNPQGEVWRSLDFEVEMKPCGTMLEFAAYYDGQRQTALKVVPAVAAGETSVETHSATTITNGTTEIVSFNHPRLLE